MKCLNKVWVGPHSVRGDPTLKPFNKEADLFKQARSPYRISFENPTDLGLTCTDMCGDVGLCDPMGFADSARVFGTGA
ncbi:hypothetical protein GCM10028785_09560 [Hydrogenophaga soli]